MVALAGFCERMKRAWVVVFCLGNMGNGPRLFPGHYGRCPETMLKIDSALTRILVTSPERSDHVTFDGGNGHYLEREVDC